MGFLLRRQNRNENMAVKARSAGNLVFVTRGEVGEKWENSSQGHGAGKGEGRQRKAVIVVNHLRTKNKQMKITPSLASTD